MLTHIWVTDTSERSVDEKMPAYYLEVEQAGKDVFRFRPQEMSYYAWCERARAKRDECDAGKLTLEEFEVCPCMQVIREYSQ